VNERPPRPPWLTRLGLGRIGFAGKWIGLAACIGFLGGLAAVGFDVLLKTIREHLLTRLTGLTAEGLGGMGSRGLWLLLILPAGGLVVGWLTIRFAPEAEGHGTEQLVKAFHQLGGRVRKRVIALKALTSAITIGSGGSAGQEGPVTQIGSGVGSLVASALRLTERDRRIFLLAGSSAGVGALFTAPLGGALFAPEVLYRKPEFEGEAIIPCIISSIVAYSTFSTITGQTKRIEIPATILSGLQHRDWRELGVYLVLAILCTLVGWVYVRTFDATRDLFDRLKGRLRPVRPAIGGLLLALLAVGLAPLAGVHGVLFGGYELMGDSIRGDIAIGTLALLVAGKILATAFTIGTGGSGGMFAPSLAIGGMLGAMVGQTAQGMFPELAVNPACFALVGMGGFFAGVAKAPIASILIVCEMTGSYGLLLPLMLVSIVHLVLAQRWTIYETQVPGLVDSPAHAGDFVVDVLARLHVADLMDRARKPEPLHQDTTLREALDFVSTSTGYYFPVVDGDERMTGIFSLSDVRRIFQATEVADLVLVRDFMVEEVVTTTPEDTLSEALSKLNEHGLHELPVVDATDPRRVLAMLTRNLLGSAYNDKLKAIRSQG